MTRKVTFSSEMNFMSVTFRALSSCLKPIVILSVNPCPDRVTRWENPACTLSGLSAVISGADAPKTGPVQASKIPPSIQKRYQYLAGIKDLLLYFFKFMKIIPKLLLRAIHFFHSSIFESGGEKLLCTRAKR
jgi:hypothetical protein